MELINMTEQFIEKIKNGGDVSNEDLMLVMPLIFIMLSEEAIVHNKNSLVFDTEKFNGNLLPLMRLIASTIPNFYNETNDKIMLPNMIVSANDGSAITPQDAKVIIFFSKIRNIFAHEVAKIPRDNGNYSFQAKYKKKDQVIWNIDTEISYLVFGLFRNLMNSYQLFDKNRIAENNLANFKNFIPSSEKMINNDNFEIFEATTQVINEQKIDLKMVINQMAELVCYFLKTRLNIEKMPSELTNDDYLYLGIYNYIFLSLCPIDFDALLNCTSKNTGNASISPEAKANRLIYANLDVTGFAVSGDPEIQVRERKISAACTSLANNNVLELALTGKREYHICIEEFVGKIQTIINLLSTRNIYAVRRIRNAVAHNRVNINSGKFLFQDNSVIVEADTTTTISLAEDLNNRLISNRVDVDVNALLNNLQEIVASLPGIYDKIKKAFEAYAIIMSETLTVQQVKEHLRALYGIDSFETTIKTR